MISDAFEGSIIMVESELASTVSNTTMRAKQ